MEVYGFKATVTKEGKWFIGSIPELHVHDQATTLRELESELKDAVDTAVELILEKGNKQKTKIKSPIIRSLLITA
jgi:predicted RNase H-like HicB family nuclease